jgi:hypothetical protein
MPGNSGIRAQMERGQGAGAGIVVSDSAGGGERVSKQGLWEVRGERGRARE